MFSNSRFLTEDNVRPIGVIEPLGSGLLRLSLFLLTLTVAATPWFLGGAIPHARLALQIGTVAASAVAIFGSLLNRSLLKPVPRLAFPLLGLTLIGGLQLLPQSPHPATQMAHAVIAERSGFLPESLSLPSHPRSVFPAETRLFVSQLLSLCLLVLVTQHSIRSVFDATLAMGGLALSGVSMAALTLSQRLGASDVVVGNHWKISTTTPFGCFVNPNNAAGWLIICLSAALFLVGVLTNRQSSSERPLQGSKHWASRADRLWLRWVSFVGNVSAMNVWQIIAVCGAILLAASTVATLSRAGIVAGALGLIAFALSRFRTSHWFAALGTILVVFALASGLLILFELDTVVLSELQTLKDPVSESTGRLLHWADSLESGRDFPVLGSGLGAYRYATLPYQRHFTGKWFQRADNQYVELFVETGLAGILCLVAFGVISILLTLQPLRFRQDQKKTRRLQAQRWLASASVCSLVALSGAAFFDYGISLPSVSASLVLVIATLAALLQEPAITHAESGGSSDASSGRKIGSRLFGLVSLSLWGGLIFASAMLIPDTLAAVRLFEVAAPVERLIQAPEIEALQSEGDQHLNQLEQTLANRPDDISSRRLYVLLIELLARRDLVHQTAMQTKMTIQQQDNLVRSINPAVLIERLNSRAIEPQVRTNAMKDIEPILKKHDWAKAAAELIDEHPLTLSMGQQVAYAGFILRDQQWIRQGVDFTRFVEPHNAPNLFVLGHFLALQGETEDARACWDQSLQASEVTRANILLELSTLQGVAAAMDRYAPETYETAARAAGPCRAIPELQHALWNLAEQLWQEAPPRVTESIALTRSTQLEATNRVDDAIKFLAEQLNETPGNIRLRKVRAKLLEKAGLNEEAYDEWLRIQSFDSDDPETPAALDKLIKLPPTTKK